MSKQQKYPTDELIVNPTDYQVVLREGHLWGQKDVVIGTTHIKNMNEMDERIFIIWKGTTMGLPTFCEVDRCENKLRRDNA